MWYTYIIVSLKTGELYKGLTSNIDQRLNDHFKGKTKFSKHRLPIKLVHVELCKSRYEARGLEKFFKSGYGREAIEQIKSEMPRW